MAKLTPIEDAIAHRHPRLIVTDAYLNNPIQFENDSRFDLSSALKEASDFNVVERDGGEFIVSDLGSPDPQLYPVEMYTPDYHRDTFYTVFDTTFSSF